MKLGFIGLGKMGSRMAGKLLKEGHDVVVWNRSSQPIEELKSQISNLKTEDVILASEARPESVLVQERTDAGQVLRQRAQDSRVASMLIVAKTVEELVASLEKPRIIWSMLPAGDATENILQEIVTFVEPGDIVIDGGNANYKDTQRRYNEFRTKNIKFLGIGVSGGIIAETNGYPLMVGGDKSAYEYIVPLLDSLAKPNGGHAYVGEGGAGHFVKMVHNGIEYGMMQAIGEGFGVLEKSTYNLNLLQVAELWQKGTIVSSFLIDRAKDALEKDPKLSNLEGIIAESGEAKWTIDAAKEANVPVPIIEDSLKFRQQSQSDSTIQNSFAAKMVAALRHEFGGHEVKKK